MTEPLGSWLNRCRTLVHDSYYASGETGFWYAVRRRDDGVYVLRWQHLTGGN